MNIKETIILWLTASATLILGCTTNKPQVEPEFRLRIISPYNRQYDFLVEDCKVNFIAKELLVQKGDSFEFNPTNVVLDSITKKYQFHLENETCMKFNTYLEKINNAQTDTIRFSPNDSYYHEVYLNGELKIRSQSVVMVRDVLQLFKPYISDEVKCCDYFQVFDLL